MKKRPRTQMFAQNKYYSVGEGGGGSYITEKSSDLVLATNKRYQLEHFTGKRLKDKLPSRGFA